MKFAYLIEPPFNYVDSAGHITGCDVELARYVFSELAVAEFEPVETEFAELLPGLRSGRWRMTTGLFGSEDRRKSALFSRPIWALSDGLLVAKGNPLDLRGYKSVADNPDAKLAVIRDQIQHRSAIEMDVRADQIMIFETYVDAAQAVRSGAASAYASVGRAHRSFIELHPDQDLENVPVPQSEKPPAFGAFAFGLDDVDFLGKVDAILSRFLGSDDHRKMVAPFGFSSGEVDLVAS